MCQRSIIKTALYFSAVQRPLKIDYFPWDGCWTGWSMLKQCQMKRTLSWQGKATLVSMNRFQWGETTVDTGESHVTSQTGVALYDGEEKVLSSRC